MDNQYKTKDILITIKKSIFTTTIFVAATLAFMNPTWGKPDNFPYFTATYEANIKGFSAKATREFKALDNNLSELSFKANSWLATLTESAQFQWEEELIHPIRFNYERVVMGKERKKALTFDTQNKKIISHYKDKTYTIPNKEDALDYLSFQLQLQYDLLTAGKENTIYRIADKDKIKEYRFAIMGEEVVDTDLGSLSTIKVKVIRENKKRATYLWLAKEWSNLLVRLEQHKNDKKEFEIQLTSAVMDGKTVSGN
jgi:hypothetical protein